MPPTIISFLKTYLSSWKGRDHREQIFALLEYLPMDEYDSIRAEFLTRLEAAVIHNMSPSQSDLLDFYSALIRQWGVYLRAQPFTLEESKPLARIISRAELLALSILECPPALPQPHSSGTGSSKPTTLSVLELYCVLGELFSHAAQNGSIRITIPLAPTVYSLVLTPISSVISIFSSVLANYKSSFEASLTSKALQTPSSTDSLYPTQLVGQFNGYIMDICNLVWRNRGFNPEDPNALGCLMPAPTTNALAKYIREVNEFSKEHKPETAFVYNVGSASSLGHHVALCNMSAACFADIEEKSVSEDQPRLNRPVTQKALSALEKDGGIKISWQEYRIKMLDWLDATGSVGIGNLMRSTMKALRKD